MPNASGSWDRRVTESREANRRSFIRHPASVSIDLRPLRGQRAQRPRLKDVSQGGLCVSSPQPVAVGTALAIRFPHQAREVQGVVAWHREESRGWSLGVVFPDPDTRFIVRMVEQMCQIEAYRARIAQQEGRCLSADAAASEWIERFGDQFPPWE